MRSGNNPHASFYASKAWRALRLVILARDEGKCRMCGCIVTGGRKHPRSTVIDHIQPHEGNPAMMWDEDNLWLVCKRDHDTHCQTYEKQGGDVRAKKLAHRVVGMDGYPIWEGR